MKERSSVSVMKSPWKILLGIVTLFCVLAISACGGTETARVYDSARVLNTSKVQAAARNVPANVDVYTVNSFSGTQTDFQRAVAVKLANDADRIVMGIDTQHNYQYVARGANVPLSSNNIAQASNAFAANYGNGDYTRATVASLNSLGQSMRMNGATSTNRPGASPLPWLLPLLIIGGLLFFLAKMRRPGLATQGAMRPTYQPPQPERPMHEYPSYDQGTVRPPTYEKGPGAVGGAAAGGAGYELGKRQGEAKPPASGTEYGSSTEYGGKGYGGKKKPDTGGGGTFGKGGADYGTTDTGGGGTYGSGGPDYERDRDR